MMAFQKFNSKAAALTAETVMEMRRRRAKDRRLWTYERLSREFKVTPNTVRNACLGLTWQHLPLEVDDESFRLNVKLSEERLDALLKDGKPTLLSPEAVVRLRKMAVEKTGIELPKDWQGETTEETVVKQSDADRMLEELIKGE